MTDGPTDRSVGGESAMFMSDGLVLELANGRRVRPVLTSPESNEPWCVTWVDDTTGEIGLGPEVDDTRVELSLTASKAVFTDDGERIYHYEWNGALYCEHDDAAFEWETGDVTCPYCGDTFHVAKPDE
jgi:uncharacterized Zn-finger protein